MVEYHPILKFSEELRLKADSSNHPQNDVRIDFFNLMANIAHHYHLERISLELPDLFADGKLLCKDSKFFHNQINDFMVLLEKENVPYRFFSNSINRGLIIDTWSSFEVCLYSICSKVFLEEDKLKIQSKKYSCIRKR